MRSEEIREGLRVRVHSRTRRLNGKVGAVAQTYGSPVYRAVDVELDDGGSELFWHYQLEPEDSGLEDRTGARGTSAAS